jgi:putative peptide zinc metalloprotease protein
MKFIYLDKKDRVRSWLTSHRLQWAVAGVVALLLLPLWRESISGRFVLEAADRALIRAQIAGTVEKVYAEEGQTILSGAPLVQLRNIPLESKRAQNEADYRVADAGVNSAELHYAETGAALQKREQLGQENRILATEVETLELKSPITGVVMTPRVTDRLGSYVTAGTELAEVDDARTLRARIYVSEYEMYKYHPNSTARLHVDGIFRKWDTRVLTVSPTSSEIAPGLLDLTKFTGMRPPTFYAIDLLVKNEEGRLKPGMAGTARIYSRRRSIAGFAYRAAADFAGRKLW